MAEPIIRVEGISKRFTLGDRRVTTFRDLVVHALHPRTWTRRAKEEEFWALKDVCFDVARGEVVGLIGRNGAGKSTLLKILSQIHPPTSGTIRLRGRVASLLEVGTGFHPELTGRENIFLNGAILGMTKKEIVRKFDEIVEFAEIARFLDTPVKRYSSGMYVRLAFAVAAHLEPEILLVDEVLAVGDVQFQKKCLGKMSEVTTEDGRTIIFVSHNLGAIQKLCRRAILLKGGRVAADGPVEETIHTYLEDIATTEAHIDLAQRTDRQGSGKVKIHRIRFQDAQEKPVTTFRTGQSMRVLFDYEGLGESFKHITISMAISNQLGELILNLVNTATGDTFMTAPRKGTIVMDMPELPLVPGTYYFNSFLTVNGEIADWVLDAGSFSVEFGDFFGTGMLPPEGQGNFLIPHHWSLQ